MERKLFVSYIQQFISVTYHLNAVKYRYYTLKVGDKTAPNAVWYYPNPTDKFKPIKDYVAFYPNMMDACYVDDEQATPQPGDFYGGWVTKNIVGGQKGFKGTLIQKLEKPL